MDRTNRHLRATLWIGVGVGLLPLAMALATLRGQPPGTYLSTSSSLNRSLVEVRRASESWERRPGPRRRVVDMVCLVPDTATFLEAIAAWDEGHAFPILIDDVELTFKFLRAFRPARIVRYPRKVEPIHPGRLWDVAVNAVGRSWTAEGEAETAVTPGDQVPRRLGPTPPGVVLSSPSSPILAGAVALAAGRFQPLVRWETPRNHGDVPSIDEARPLAASLEARVADRIAGHSKLGDDCDFLTLAGDWPYRYKDQDGDGAFDDLVGRSSDAAPGAGAPARWAFTGRLLGDATASVYRAMCSLFLQPESALLFNTYKDPGQPWVEYAMTRAPDRLARLTNVTLREGDRASLDEWSRRFDPTNGFGLALINSHGGPTIFNLPGGPGQTGDIPPSVPAAVLMIHSFSAADPNDPGTIAGRWLANGAFVYFGGMYEPYLQAFRPPELVAGLIAEGIPLGAAVRRSPPEPFGQPWRLVYLGDPLFRLQLREGRAPRLDTWSPLDSWPAYREFAQPEAGAPEGTRLNWALKTALYQFQRTARPQQRIDLPRVLLALARERLEDRLRPVYDALLIDTLLGAVPPDPRALLERLSLIPAAGRTPAVERALEPLQAASLQREIATRNFPRALALWGDMLRTEPTPPFLQTVTERVAALADTATRRLDWRSRLQEALSRLGDRSPRTPIVAAALRSVEQELADQTK